MWGNFRQPFTQASFAALVSLDRRKDIFQAESRFGIALQGFERHVLDEMGWQPEYNSVWRTAAVNRPETREIVTQRPGQSVNQCTVLFQQLHMPLSQGRISDMALAGFLFCPFRSLPPWR